MKKFIYLLSLVIVATLFSCEDETVVPDNQSEITFEMIQGYWDWYSLEFEGVVYTYCSEDLRFDYALSTLNLEFTTEQWLTKSSSCNSDMEEYVSPTVVYKFENDQFIINEGGMVFDLLSTPEDIKNGELKIKLISGVNVTYPYGGIYILKKI